MSEHTIHSGIQIVFRDIGFSFGWVQMTPTIFPGHITSANRNIHYVRLSK
jgi:hypothetical protein